MRIIVLIVLGSLLTISAKATDEKKVIGKLTEVNLSVHQDTVRSKSKCDPVPILQSPGSEPSQATGQVRKINDSLYVGKKDGVTFVMERIDRQVPDTAPRREFWKNFARGENKNH